MVPYDHCHQGYEHITLHLHIRMCAVGGNGPHDASFPEHAREYHKGEGCPRIAERPVSRHEYAGSAKQGHAGCREQENLLQ